MSNIQYVIVEKQAPVTKVIGVAGEDVTVQIVNPQNKVVVEAVGLFQAPSNNGEGGSSPSAEYEIVTSVDGAQTLHVPVDFYNAGHRLFINGLRQQHSGYSVSGRSVVLPTDLGIKSLDVLTFEYFPI